MKWAEVRLTERVLDSGRTRNWSKTCATKSTRLTSLVEDVDEENMLVYLSGCAKQGQWLRWESAVQADSPWKKLLYVLTSELLSFQINAINDQLAPPANLRLWSKSNLLLCQLWSHQNCTLHHILNYCSFLLQKNGRYNWGHDQTLRAIAIVLAPYIDQANRKKNNTSSKFDPYCSIPYSRWHNISMILEPSTTVVKRDDEANNILTKAGDWTFLMDEEHTQVVFPSEKAEIAKRPDITIYSLATKNVITIKLTVPSKKNLANAYARKKI